MKAVQRSVSQTCIWGGNPVTDGGQSPLRARALQEGDTPSLMDPGVSGGTDFTLRANFFCGGQQHPLLTRAELGKRRWRMPLGSGPGQDADNTFSVARETHDTQGASAMATQHLRQSPACRRHRPCHPAAWDAGNTRWGRGDAPGTCCGPQLFSPRAAGGALLPPLQHHLPEKSLPAPSARRR